MAAATDQLAARKALQPEADCMYCMYGVPASDQAAVAERDFCSSSCVLYNTRADQTEPEECKA